MHKKDSIVVVSILLLLFSFSLFAQLPDVIKESFDYPEGDLLDQGGSGNGWMGPWEQHTTGIATVINGTLGYEGVPQTGGYLEVSEAGTIWRLFEEPWVDEGQAFWVSLLYQRFDGHDVDDSFNGFSLFNGASTELLYIGKPWATKVIGMDAHRASGAVRTERDAYELTWIVVKMQMNGTDDNDRAYLWINPDPAAEPDTTTADTVALWEGSNGFDRVRIGSGNTPTPAECLYDEICFSATYEGLTVETDVAEKIIAPMQFGLTGNYPNPFNPATTIAYSIDRTRHISIEVYDPLGHKIRTLWAGSQGAGDHNIQWDGTDDKGRMVSSGVYLYRLLTDNNVETRKMMLLR